LYLLIDMTDLPPQVNSLSLHLVPKTPVRSGRRWRFVATRPLPRESTSGRLRACSRGW
jgi:hypothetical protein